MVADAEIAAVYEAFGGRYGEARPLTQRDCEALREGLPEQLAVPLIRIGSGATACTPGGVFIIEDSSAEGARPEILREVSRGTQAVAVSLDPEGLPRLAWYREGRPAAAMIANAPGRVSGLGSAEIEQVIASAPGLRDRLSEVRRCAALPAVLELAARLTGVSLKPGWSEQALPGGIVLPVLDDAAPRAESAGAPDLPRPQAAALIEAAPDAAVAAAVPLQARRLAEDADLSRWPEALELIGLLASRPAHTDVTARTEHSPGRAPILWRDSSISLLIRRLSSSLHWHTVIDPSTDPEPPLRTVTTALGALRSAAAVFTGDEVPGEQGARVALHRLVSGRPNRLGPAAVVDLAADLGVPPPRRRPTARDEAARDNSRRHQEATAAVRGFAGRLPADGSWVAPAWPMPVPDLSPGHCLLLAADLSPDELLARAADGRPIESATVVGATGLGTAVPGTRARLAVGRVGSWSLLVEQGSSFTPRPEVLRRVGAGTRLLCVEHDAVLRLSYCEDGVLVDRFEPLFPERRAGADPGRLDPHLEAIGRIEEVNAANAAQAAAVPFRVAEAILGTTPGSAEPLNDAETSAPFAAITAAHVDTFLVDVLGPPPPRGASESPGAVEPTTTPGGLTWWPRPADPGRVERQRITPRAGNPRPSAIAAGRATAVGPRASGPQANPRHTS